jgi:hypothetical protein
LPTVAGQKFFQISTYACTDFGAGFTIYYIGKLFYDVSATDAINYATSWKVVDSIPDEVIGFLY